MPPVTDPLTGLAVGPIVDATPAKMPSRVTIPGRLITLVPLNANEHFASLADGACGPENAALWAYLFEPPFMDRALFREHLERKSESKDPLFFALIDNASGKAAGYAALMRIDPVHRSIEIGSILYTKTLQKTAAATEAMYLFARHAFEDLGYRRYEWKCNSLNEPSRRAALRLGFTFEGIFRQHYIIKERNRDTAWFSMLDTEWPDRKANFERWLDPTNFDANGKQKSPLARA